ncbi:hypothetical protein P5V15_009554 [Pogonomyrmex californicus]
MFSFLTKIQKQAESKIPKNWRLFHATDFHTLMYPCFTFCRILGIFPYRINATSFEISKPLVILSAIIVYVCCIRVLIVIYNVNVSGKIDMADIPRKIHCNFYYALSIFITIVTHILTSPRMRLLQTIAKISSTLPTKSYQKLSWLIHAKDIFSFLYVPIFIIILGTKINVDVLFAFSITHINLLVLQVNMMYVNCVCILKACFKRINDNLINMKTLVVNDASHLGLINHEHRRSFLLLKLKVLQKQYLEVSDTVQMLNMIFSLQLVATIIMHFGDIVFNLYYYVLMQQSMFIIPTEKQLFHKYFVMWMVFFFIKTIFLTWACETGKKQALKIGTTIHDVLNCTSDKQIKNELKLFSLHILHRTNTFSAKVFTVDASFFAAVVGNVTTYVFILIQFLNIINSCNEKAIHNIMF